MAKFFALDDETYTAMLQYMEGFMQTECSGTENDIRFYDEDFWLQDTAVIENVEYRNGEWNIFLVFAYHTQPLKLIKRKIKNYCCPKKAALTAYYMRRQAAKDQRGTLTVKKENFVVNFS